MNQASDSDPTWVSPVLRGYGQERVTLSYRNQYLVVLKRLKTFRQYPVVFVPAFQRTDVQELRGMMQDDHYHSLAISQLQAFLNSRILKP